MLVKALRAGSVIAELVLEQGCAAGLVAPQRAAAELARQVADPASPLRKGKVTCNASSLRVLNPAAAADTGAASGGGETGKEAGLADLGGLNVNGEGAGTEPTHSGIHEAETAGETSVGDKVERAAARAADADHSQDSEEEEEAEFDDDVLAAALADLRDAVAGDSRLPRTRHASEYHLLI